MTEKSRILVVDDEESHRIMLRAVLQDAGYDISEAADGWEAVRKVEQEAFDLILLDIRMRDLDGIEALGEIRKISPRVPVLIMTAYASVKTAVEALKSGAFDYLTKPLDVDELKILIEKALEIYQLREENIALKERLASRFDFSRIIGSSRKMKEVFETLSLVAPTDATVLILGESGTGKELVANSIHQNSSRSNQRFVKVSCAALPETLLESELFGHERGAFTGATGVQAGCFELANRGTLFLDEIAEMPLALQPKLLRVLEDRRVRRVGGSQEFLVDVRVLAATNKEPRNAVEVGKLREDLFYRLNVFTVALPPLRDRKSDIPLLTQAFIREFNSKHGAKVESCKTDTLEMLKAYSWPGNVRELRNIMERAVILTKGSWIEPSHLPAYLLGSPAPKTGTRITLPVGVTAAEAEKELILRTLRQTGNNKAEAARQLGLDVKTIRNKLKAYGINN